MSTEFDDYYSIKYKDSKIYKGVRIEGILFEEYWHRNYRKNISFKIKILFKTILGFILGFVPIKIEKNFKTSDCLRKIFFILSFDLSHQNKIGQILDNLKNKFNKDEIVLVTFQKEIYLEQVKKKYLVIYINIPKFLTKLKYKKYTKWKYLATLSRQLEIVNIASDIIESLKPKLIITTQDFYLSDYIFTILAKKNKVKTMTHIHGMILSENVGAYKYLYSDYIMIWGERDLEILKEYIEVERLFVVGTDKFNNLLKNKEKEKTKIVLCLTNIPNFYDSEYKIIEEFMKIDYKNEKIIKLHPSINLKKFKKRNKHLLFQKIKISTDYKDIEEAKYLITYKTTASLDGMISGASVIELNLDLNVLKNDFFKNLPESFINYLDLSLEIEKREKNKDYFDLIIKKQNRFLEYTIASFYSSENTKRIIEKILEKN